MRQAAANISSKAVFGAKMSENDVKIALLFIFEALNAIFFRIFFFPKKCSLKNELPVKILSCYGHFSQSYDFFSKLTFQRFSLNFYTKMTPTP